MDSVKVLSVKKKTNKAHMSSWQHLRQVKWVPSMQVESGLEFAGFQPSLGKEQQVELRTTKWVSASSETLLPALLHSF